MRLIDADSVTIDILSMVQLSACVLPVAVGIILNTRTAVNAVRH